MLGEHRCPFKKRDANRLDVRFGSNFQDDLVLMLTCAPQYFREFVIIGTCEDNSFDLALLESLGVLWVVKANHLNA